MTGIIASGQLVTVRPLAETEAIEKGMVVLCKVRGAEYLHLVKAVRGHEVLIGNNRGGENGWTSRNAVYGALVSVAD